MNFPTACVSLSDDKIFARNVRAIYQSLNDSGNDWLDTGKSMTMTVTVTQPEHCIFRMQVSDIDHDPKVRSDITYDFNKFTSLDSSIGMFTMPVFSGECAVTNESKGCIKPFIGARQLFVPVASSQAAANYMKSKYCTGRAF